MFLNFFLGLPGGAEVKNPPHAHAEDKKRHRFDPGLGRFPEEDNPPQISCLENPMDRGAWWVHKESCN